MPKNIEIKARLAESETVLEAALQLGQGSVTIIHQRDTFFHCPYGRLKLREFDDGSAELIAYHRADQAGPKTSEYVLSPTGNAESLLHALELSLGVRAVVEKTRRLVMIGRTRVHIDEVRGLGSFIELEVVLADGESESQGQREADELMGKLGIQQQDLIQGAYVDLLDADS